MRRGLIEEVASVLAEGHAPRAPGLDGIGIREAVDTCTAAARAASVADGHHLSTRQYAKRQQTWFRHQLDGRGAHARRDAASRAARGRDRGGLGARAAHEDRHFLRPPGPSR